MNLSTTHFLLDVGGKEIIPQDHSSAEGDGRRIHTARVRTFLSTGSTYSLPCAGDADQTVLMERSLHGDQHPLALNLSENDGVTGLLLANPAVWRARVVEDLLIESASTCVRRRSLQVAPLRAMLGSCVSPHAHEAIISLPVARMPKGPLGGFSISGPRGAAMVLPRLEIAERELSYLASLAQRAGVLIDDALREPLIEILSFADEWIGMGSPDDASKYLAPYIEAPSLGAVLERLAGVDQEASRILSPRRAPTKYVRATEKPSLVVPRLLGSGFAPELDTAVKALESYAALLTNVESLAESSDVAAELLESLSDYGSHYDLVAAMTVPLDEAFVVKYEERRPLILGNWTNRGSQTVEAADALSNHIAVRVSDPNVRLRASRLAVHGHRSADPAYEPATHADTQTTTWYGHEPGREVRVDVEFSVRLLPRLLVVPTAVAVLNALIAVALVIEGVTDLATLAIVTSPAALAASLLTTREPSTLGSRLRRLSTVLLGASLILLIATATCLFAYGQLSDC